MNSKENRSPALKRDFEEDISKKKTSNRRCFRNLIPISHSIKPRSYGNDPIKSSKLRVEYVCVCTKSFSSILSKHRKLYVLKFSIRLDAGAWPGKGGEEPVEIIDAFIMF
jgi:hypothetical protein